jgi:hypothetical protein
MEVLARGYVILPPACAGGFSFQHFSPPADDLLKDKEVRVVLTVMCLTRPGHEGRVLSIPGMTPRLAWASLNKKARPSPEGRALHSAEICATGPFLFFEKSYSFPWFASDAGKTLP